MKFWVDEVAFVTEGSPAQRRERNAPVYETIGRDADRESPDFGDHDHEYLT